MRTLRFLCPVTGRAINSGIITTAQSILLMQDEKVNVYCPHCRRTHSTRICEACPEEPTGLPPRSHVIAMRKIA